MGGTRGRRCRTSLDSWRRVGGNWTALDLSTTCTDALLRPRGNGSQQSTIHITRETYREGKMTACSPAKICGGGSCRLERGMSGWLGEAGISYLQLATLRLSGWFSSRFSDRPSTSPSNFPFYSFSLSSSSSTSSSSFSLPHYFDYDI